MTRKAKRATICVILTVIFLKSTSGWKHKLVVPGSPLAHTVTSLLLLPVDSKAAYGCSSCSSDCSVEPNTLGYNLFYHLRKDHFSLEICIPIKIET